MIWNQKISYFIGYELGWCIFDDKNVILTTFNNLLLFSEPNQWTGGGWPDDCARLFQQRRTRGSSQCSLLFAQESALTQVDAPLLLHERSYHTAWPKPTSIQRPDRQLQRIAANAQQCTAPTDEVPENLIDGYATCLQPHLPSRTRPERSWAAVIHLAAAVLPQQRVREAILNLLNLFSCN